MGQDVEEENTGMIEMDDDVVTSLSAPKPRSSSSKKRSRNPTETLGEPSKKTTKTGPNWAILEHIWPANERPESLRDAEWIEKQTIGDLMTLHKVYLKKEQKEQGQAIGRATKDTKPPLVRFEAANDDCDKELNPARFQRMPISCPKHYWSKISYLCIPLL